MIIPYQAEHLHRLMLQPAQLMMKPQMDENYAKALEIPNFAYTAIKNDRVLACAGVLPIWEGRGEAWAMLAADIGTDFVFIHNATRKYLRECGIRRIEAVVDAQFRQAKRWVMTLGFEYEGWMKAYTPDGRDCIRFARVS